MGQVHAIERRALPDLTSSSEATPSYIAMRDRIISLYRDMPGRPLHAQDCLRHLAADPESVLRIHSFLDFWGIINTDAEGRIRFKKTLRMLSEPPPAPRRGAGRGAASKDPSKDGVRGFGRCAVTGQPLQRLCYALKSDPKYMLSPMAYMQVPLACIHLSCVRARPAVISRTRAGWIRCPPPLVPNGS